MIIMCLWFCTQNVVLQDDTGAEREQRCLTAWQSSTPGCWCFCGGQAVFELSGPHGLLVATKTLYSSA